MSLEREREKEQILLCIAHFFTITQFNGYDVFSQSAMAWSTELEETLVERWQVGNKLSTRFVLSLIVQL